MNNLAHYVLTLRLLPLMQRTAAFAPPGTVRIVMQSSELHRMAPSDTKFEFKEEVNSITDETLLYVPPSISAASSLPRPGMRAPSWA